MKAGRVLRLSIGLILGTLVACSTFSRGDNLPETSGNMQRDQPMTLIFWHAWPSPDQYILVKLVDRYNHTHPQVQVILQAMSLASLTSEMRTSITSGNGPHLLLLQNHIIGELAHDESLLRLDELVQQDIIERLIPTTVQGAQVQQSDGSTALFGIPITFDTLALYYNTAIFETPLPEEIEGVRAMAHRVVEDARYPMKWGLAYTLSLDKTIGYLDAFDGHVLDTQGNLILNQEGRVGTERWLEWLLSLHQDHDILAIRDSITVSSA
jgi:ABC-type glycerol-3-phosphate transport system substrate-binding protein